METLPEVPVSGAPPVGASTGSTLGTIAAGLIPGVGSILGGILSNNAAQAAAQKQMDFQERMASTQYQRTVKDMKAAGLNPMLAAFGGGVDAAPSGASYQPQNPVSPSLASTFASSALQLQSLGADIFGTLSSAKKDRATAAAADATRLLTDVQRTGAIADNEQREAVGRVFREHPEALGWFKALLGSIGVSAKF